MIEKCLKDRIYIVTIKAFKAVRTPFPMIQRILLLICVFQAVLLPPVYGDVDTISNIDRIKAAVNGEIITQGDIDLFLLTASRDNQEREQKERFALQQLINRILINQKAEELGIVLPSSYLDERTGKLHGDYPNVPRQVLKEYIKADELWRAVNMSEIAPRVKVDPEDILRYYETFPEEFHEPAKVLIRDIAVKYHLPMDIEAGIEDIRSTLNGAAADASDRESIEAVEALNKKIVNHSGDPDELLDEIKAQLRLLQASDDKLIQIEASKLFEKYSSFKTEKRAQQICETVLKRISEGADFESLVIEFSEGPYRNNGGRWDWFARNGLNRKLEAIEEAAFNLENQGISGVIDADNTKHIIQKIAEHEATVMALSSPEVQEMIHEKISRQKEADQRRLLLEELRSRAYIKIYD
jgi:parvulin-like peptidyl-prolyl isomerase